MAAALHAYLLTEDTPTVQVVQHGGFGPEARSVLRAVSANQRWDSQKMSWFYPYRPSVILGLREAAHLLRMELHLDPTLAQVENTLENESLRELEIRKLMQAYIDDPKLDVGGYNTSAVPPPWRHQALAWHWSMRVNCLYLQHKMGLGKTREGSDIIRGKYDIGAVREPFQVELPDRVSKSLNRPLPARLGTVGGVLVACPRGVMVEWIEQLWKWQQIQAVPIIGGSVEIKRRRAGIPAWVHICSYDSLETVEGNQYDGIIADELHLVANEDSNRFNRLWSLREDCTWVVGLSGTPQTNGLSSLWSQFYFLDGGRTLGATFDAFRKKYFTQEGRQRSQNASAEKAITEAISRIAWPLSMQVAFPGKPQKINQTIRVPMTPEQSKYYEKVRTEQETDILTGKVTLAVAMTRIMKLMQVAQGFVFDDDKVVQQFSSAKLNALEEMLTGAGDLTDKRVVVWCAFKPEHAMICKMLEKHKVKHMAMKGGMSDKERESFKHIWNTDSTQRVLVGMISMGIGLNLHAPQCVDEKGMPARVSTTVFMGMDWRVTVLEQAMDRVYRGDQVETCLYRYLLSDDLDSCDDQGNSLKPIDVRVYEALMSKLEQAVRVDENTIEYVRHLLAA